MDRSMRARVTVAVVIVVLLLGVGAGWFYEQRSASAQAGAGGSYRVRVTRDGKELASYDLTGLEAIGMKKTVDQGSPQEGPPVIDVLRKSGVTEFSAVTVIGLGARDGGRLELPKSGIGPETVFDVTKRGTVKVVGPGIERAQRVRDVTEIQVR